MLIGIDIGGTKCAVILADDAGNIQSREQKATTTCEEMLDFFSKRCKEITQEYSVRAIGISCGGPLDSVRGVIQSPPNLPGWDDMPICELLQKQTGVPAFLCNDANACALAEWRYGAGKNSRNMIFLTFGTGMGAGLILDGKLYEGTTGMAGEVGHIRLSQTGPVGYGKEGSFEGFCSGGGIGRMGRDAALTAIRAGKPFKWCREEKDLPEINAKTIADAAKAGDSDAIAVYDACAEKLGMGISLLLDLFNPEVIVIGSVFARSEELLRKKMEEVIKNEALAQCVRDCRIVPAALGDAIGDYAALAVAADGLEKQNV